MKRFSTAHDTLYDMLFNFPREKRGKVELSRRLHTKRIVPSEEGVPGLNKRSLVTNVKSFDESLEVITRKTYHELSVFVGGIHQRSTIVCKNSNQCGHD